MHFSIPLGKMMLMAINCEQEAGNYVIYNMLLKFSLIFVINKTSFSKCDKFMFNCALPQSMSRKCPVINLYKFS